MDQQALSVTPCRSLGALLLAAYLVGRARDAVVMDGGETRRLITRAGIDGPRASPISQRLCQGPLRSVCAGGNGRARSRNSLLERLYQ